MPQIKEYTAENTALRPTEEGVSAFAYAGRRVGAFYNQAGEAIARGAAAVNRAYTGIGKAVGEGVEQGEQIAAHQEISHGMATFAQSQDDMIQQWKRIVSDPTLDPNDQSIKARFFEQTFEPWADQYIKAFNTPHGQDFATDHINHLRDHLVTTTSADMSGLARIAVKTNIEKSENSWTNTAFNDPSAVSYLLDSAKKSIDGIVASSPGLKGLDAAEVNMEVTQRAKEQIVKSGAFGAISKAADPEAEADKWIKQYPDLIKGDEAKQFAKAAQVQARTNLVAQKQIELYNRQQGRDGVEAARNDIWSKNVTFDAQTGRAVIKPDFFQQAIKIPQRFPNAPNATETAKTLLDWGEHQQQPGKAVSNPATAADLDGRMFDPDNPTTQLQILRAEADGKLSHQDARNREQLVTSRDQAPIKDPMFKAAMDGAKEQIEFKVRGLNLEPGKFATFQQEFFNRYLQQYRAGTLPPNALDLSDPKSMISETINKYISPLAKTIRGNGGVGSTGVTPPVSAPKVPVLPPKDQLVVGQTYQTSGGPGVWTGTGFKLAPRAQAMKPGEM